MGVKFDDIFKVPSTALYLNLGHPSLSFNLQWAAKIFIMFVFYTPTFAAFMYSSIFHDSFSKICTNLSVATIYSIISFYYGILFLYKKRFSIMIKTVEEDLQRSRELFPEDEDVVREYIAKGKQAARFWFTVCILNGGMFIFKPVLATCYSAIMGEFKLVAIFELTYPTIIEEKKHEYLVYFVIFGLQSFYIVFSCFMFTGFNPLGLICIMHACGQIQLAIRQMETLFSEKDIDVEENIKKIRNIARHVQHIYSFVDEIQQTHQILYEMCLKTSSYTIPFACFGMIRSYEEGSLSIDIMVFVCGCIVQCGSPCYYGDVLLSKGEELRVAIYGCGWARFWIPKSRSSILLMLTRTARPLGIRAVFCATSLEAFSDAMNQSYIIFNVVNAALK